MKSRFHPRPFFFLALTLLAVAITLTFIGNYSKPASVILESDDRHGHDRSDDDRDDAASKSRRDGIKNAARSRISSAKLVGDIKKVGLFCGNSFGFDAVDT